MISKSDFKAPLKSLTKLQREKVLNYRRKEEEEKIAVLGQDSERKAIPWVQKEVAVEEKKDKEYFWLILDLLKRHQKKNIAYFRILTQVFLHFLKKEDILKKYFIEIETNDIGIKVEIKGTNYYGAFRVCGLPSYDFHACNILAIKVGNTIAKLEGYYRKTNGGVALPDQEDLKIYGRN